MFDRNKVIAALEQKRGRFQAYGVRQQAEHERLAVRVERFQAQSFASLEQTLSDIGVAWPGARPTVEFERADQLCIPFTQQWRDHRESRAWAFNVLLNRPVLAVDGSQIPPSKDVWPPVAAVQIGWFINEHRAGGSYTKDVLFDVLAPDELEEDTDGHSDSGFLNQQINRIRFVRECEKLCELMASYADAAPLEKPLCFFDGSFIISFAGKMADAAPYTRAVQQLLACSERYAVPLVGFVDRSFSHDMISLIETVQQAPGAIPMSDANLLATYLPRWGDRSPLFACARGDELSKWGKADFYEDVLFTYVRLTADHPPARIELPRWILAAGRADEILDLVRAECVVGSGYPYAVETADAVAVISQQDRQRFYAYYQQILQEAGMALQQTRKAMSKQARR
ncbi:MAG: DNA double-strand break repair nuclease NurA [Caldilineaceae bacterium]|nr:DNA double-strand break repair nuclease NurA [Caldilineaceae bacterium]